MTADAPQLAMVAGEASGDLLASLLLRRRAQALAIGPHVRHRRPEDGERGLRRLVAAPTSWRCAAMSRCCATTARSPASAARWPSACCSNGPMLSSASTRPTSTSAWRSACATPGCARSSSSARRSGPGAAGACRRSRARVDHVLCLFPFEPEILQRARRRQPPSSAIRWPMRFRCEPPRAASRAALGLRRRRRRGRGAAGQPALGDPGTSRRPFCKPRDRMHAQRPDAALRAAGGCPGLRALLEPLVATGRAACRSLLLDGRRTRRSPPAT